MTWPLSQDYNETIQTPTACFSDAELCQGQVVTNALGLPMPRSGNFADVYAVDCPDTKSKWAVKCFTREIAGLKERYREISAYLKQTPLPFMVDFTYLEQGIRVRGQWFPILKMRWVEGFTLNEFVANSLDKPQVLDMLSQIWVKMAMKLRESQMAHCDLQHGNVLLVPGSKASSLRVKLVDYDGMCVPALTLLKSAELGHPNFQHPQRAKESIYSLEVDRFSHLVIYTALRSLIVGGRPLWEKFDNSDNLLFRQQDFDAPVESDIFAELSKLNDPLVKKLVGALIEALKKPLDRTPLLEDLAPKVPKAAATEPSTPPAQEQQSEDPFASITTASPTGKKQKASQKSKAPVLIGFAAVAVVGMVGLVAGGFMLRSGDEADKAKEAAASSDPDNIQVAKKSPPSVPDSKTTLPKPKTEITPEKTKPKTEPKPGPDTESKTDPKAEPKTKPEAKLEPKPEPKPGPEPEAKPEPKRVPKPEPKPEPTAREKRKKPPVPDETAQANALKNIKDIFKGEYANANKKPSDMSTLTTKLLQQAAETKDDPASEFVLLREASDLAARAGDALTTAKAIDDLAARFDVNAAKMKVDALEKVGSVRGTLSSNKDLLDVALAAVQEAVDADDYGAADRFLKVAGDAARKMKNIPLLNRVQARTKDVEPIKNEYEKIKNAAEVLNKRPDDPAANGAVGRFRCFVKGDWDTGLALLAKGNDATLKPLAEKDLAHPTDAEEQIKLADGWWDLAEVEPAKSKLNLQRRAYKWYEEALPMLMGLAKAKVEKRIAELDKVMPKESVDLLRLIKPEKHSAVGKWQCDGKVLVSERMSHARLTIPYIPGEEYIIKVKVERKQGDDAFALGLVAGGSQFYCFFDGWDSISGLDQIDGKWPAENGTARKGRVLWPNQPRELTCIVRKKSIGVTVEGQLQPLVYWGGDYKRLTVNPDFAVPDKRTLFIASHACVFQITRLEYIPITGKGKRLD